MVPARLMLPALLLGGTVSAASIPPAHAAAAAKAKSWLDAVRQPNGLLDSQADRADVCFTYDQGVAAAAYAALGDTAKARAVLAALQGLQAPTGAWNTAYTGKGTQAEGMIWIGPIYWVALAANRYRHVTGNPRFDEMAKKALSSTLKYRKTDGSVAGGEDERGVPYTYVSVEENLDGYAAFKAFGMDADAEKIRAWLVSKAWDAAKSRWRVGPGEEADFLDVQTWGVQSLGAAGPAGNDKALDYALARMRLTKASGGISVEGFDFNGDKDDIWLEGTGQMAAALKTAGRGAEADHFLDEIIKAQKPDGSIAYSLTGGTTGDGWDMPLVAAVSSTGWFILAAYGINPFHLDRDVVSVTPSGRRSGAQSRGPRRAFPTPSLSPDDRDALGRRPAAIPQQRP